MKPASRPIYAVALACWPLWYCVAVLGVALVMAVGFVVVLIGVVHPPSADRFRRWAGGSK